MSDEYTGHDEYVEPTEIVTRINRWLLNKMLLWADPNMTAPLWQVDPFQAYESLSEEEKCERSYHFAAIFKAL